MKLTGELRGVQTDIFSDEVRIVLKVNERQAIADEYDELKNTTLSIEIKKFKAQRSLNANAYFHKLVGEIAGKLGVSNAHCKNMLIARYGQPQLLPDGSPMIYKTNATWEYMRELETIHSIPIRYEADATFYKLYRGSHEYDTAEMSRLIDGTVSEAEALGIGTVTEQELEKIKKAWGAK